MIDLAVLGTVLGASVLGSLHCAGMCGPLAAVASAPGRTHLPVLAERRHAASSAAHYNLGRLASYTVLGLVAGGAGALLDLGGAMLGVQGVALVLAGATLVVMGARGLWRFMRGHASSVASGPVVRWATRLRTHRSFPALLGGLTGLMPCGWLWAYVVVAAGTGSILGGAAVMATFWLGTVPALALVGVALGKLSRRAGAHLRWAVPLLMLVAGGLTLSTRGRMVWTTATAPAAASTDQTAAEAPQPACH
ncbi:MAG: sulfite exporter TauE/SafE family protein [Nannocystaceae bacterium]|nr:sulfite exporter TauE/SafE family protein [bacterium]